MSRSPACGPSSNKTARMASNVRAVAKGPDRPSQAVSAKEGTDRSAGPIEHMDVVVTTSARSNMGGRRRIVDLEDLIVTHDGASPPDRLVSDQPS